MQHRSLVVLTETKRMVVAFGYRITTDWSVFKYATNQSADPAPLIFRSVSNEPFRLCDWSNFEHYKKRTKDHRMSVNAFLRDSQRPDSETINHTRDYLLTTAKANLDSSFFLSDMVYTYFVFPCLLVSVCQMWSPECNEINELLHEL